MIKNITIGQYIPGDTIIHKLDPRIKIVGSILFMIILFVVKELWVFGIRRIVRYILAKAIRIA